MWGIRNPLVRVHPGAREREQALLDSNTRLAAAQQAAWEAKRTDMREAIKHEFLMYVAGPVRNRVTLRLSACRRDKDGWTAHFFPTTQVLATAIIVPVTAEFASTAELGKEYTFTFKPKRAA